LILKLLETNDDADGGPASCDTDSEALAAVNGEDAPGKDQDLVHAASGVARGLVHDSSMAGSDTLLVGRSRSESAASDLSRWMNVFLTPKGDLEDADKCEIGKDLLPSLVIPSAFDNDPILTSSEFPSKKVGVKSNVTFGVLPPLSLFVPLRAPSGKNTDSLHVDGSSETGAGGAVAIFLMSSSSSESLDSGSRWMNVFLILRLPCLEHGKLSSKPSKLKLLHDIHEVRALGASHTL
jgi:hypothetical protein